jgi:hypothetical protein
MHGLCIFAVGLYPTERDTLATMQPLLEHGAVHASPRPPILLAGRREDPSIAHTSERTIEVRDLIRLEHVTAGSSVGRRSHA